MSKKYVTTMKRFTAVSFKIIRIEADSNFQAVITGEFTLIDGDEKQALPQVQLRAGQSAMLDGIVLKTRSKFVKP